MPFESIYPPVEVPNIDIWGLLFETNGRSYPDDQVIYVDSNNNRSYTYRDVRDIAVEFGKALQKKFNWQKGDVLGVFSTNCIDFPSTVWGCLWAGGVASLANPAYNAEELCFQLQDSNAKALVTQKALLPIAVEAARRAGIAHDRIILIGDEWDVAHNYYHLSSLLNVGAPHIQRVNINPSDDVAFLIYSSGTTGRPKGVMLTHTNIVSNILMLHSVDSHNMHWDSTSTRKADKVIAFIPFYHSYGLTALVHLPMFRGIQTVVMPKFDVEKFCSIIERHRITFAYLVPPVLLILGKSSLVSRYDLSSIRMINSGAAPLTKELVNMVFERFRIPIIQGYGLSETSPVVCQQSWEDWGGAVGSVGKLICNQTVKFVSPEGFEVPNGEAGELWVKGPNVFKGYLNNVDGTRNALTDDNYFKTGDIGYQDSNGNVFITDRIKELIKYNGFQVAPAVLEGLLLSHPQIDDVAVVGFYNPDLASEVPRAYIVPAEGVVRNETLATEVQEWLAARVANHMRLRGGIAFIDQIPKSASGKIQRVPLRLLAKQDSQRLKTKL